MIMYFLGGKKWLFNFFEKLYIYIIEKIILRWCIFFVEKNNDVVDKYRNFILFGCFMNIMYNSFYW